MARHRYTRKASALSDSNYIPRHMAPTTKGSVSYGMTDPAAGVQGEQVRRSAALMSGLVIISRITGFIRTWGQAYALGVTLLASCYTVASNLPNQLYELVMGGMLATSFLPVYLSTKEKYGRKGASAYASNLISILLLFMGVLSILGIVFAVQFIWTQSFTAQSAFDFDRAVYFFRFFAVEILLYGFSAVMSGILDAERDYFWSCGAPILNNLVCTASFFIYVWLFPQSEALAMLVLAIGNPAGVAIQVLAQLPAARRHGVRLNWRINWRDPLLKETIAIGAPTLFVTAMAFITWSVQTTTLFSVTRDGPSIAYYARLWYTLPYAIIAIPITIAMFTEMSTMISRGDRAGFRRGITSGVSQLFFFLIPSAMLLAVFSRYLILLLAFGKFDMNGIGETSVYLCALALSLPFYGVETYLQKVCSAFRCMRCFAEANVVATILQVVICFGLTPLFGLPVVAFSSTVFFIVVDVITLVHLRRKLGRIDLYTIGASMCKACVVGLVGVVVGWVVSGALFGIASKVISQSGASVVALLCGGISALAAALGFAVISKMPEVSFIKYALKRRGR